MSLFKAIARDIRRREKLRKEMRKKREIEKKTRKWKKKYEIRKGVYRDIRQGGRRQ